jgi:integrase/recombinase XerD
MTSLRQRMIEDMQIRNLADNTQQSYLLQIACFAKHFNQSPEEIGPEGRGGPHRLDTDLKF